MTDPAWRIILLLITLATLGTLSACGQSGDLFIPEEPVAQEQSENSEQDDKE